jgi:alpha/beta superfamily hydrolase
MIPAQPPLEGVLHAPSLELIHGGAVVCHPHPRYGGDMGYPVVAGMARELAARGAWALRFNFRGVGESSGESTAGSEEWRDVLAAHAFLGEELGGGTLALAGYSFGGLMALRAAGERDAAVAALALVGLPLRLRGLALPDLAPVRERNIPVLVIVGEDDEYGPPEEVRAALSALGSTVKVVEIAGADHFYIPQRAEVATVVADFLVQVLGQASPG